MEDLQIIPSRYGERAYNESVQSGAHSLEQSARCWNRLKQFGTQKSRLPDGHLPPWTRLFDIRLLAEERRSSSFN